MSQDLPLDDQAVASDPDEADIAFWMLTHGRPHTEEEEREAMMETSERHDPVLDRIDDLEEDDEDEDDDDVEFFEDNDQEDDDGDYE